MIDNQHPESTRVRWLDLACGRGQIIGALDKNSSAEARSNIEYWGYDINEQFARETRRTAGRLGLASIDIKMGDLSDFNKLCDAGSRFDFITLPNTVHEVAPKHLAATLVDCLVRLSESSTLFLYDMERIRPPELGAIPWTRDEVRKIIRTMLDELGAPEYKTEVGLWVHCTSNAWNVQFPAAVPRGHARGGSGAAPSDGR